MTSSFIGTVFSLEIVTRYEGCMLWNEHFTESILLFAL